MPEGDTLFRIADTLSRALGGKQVTRFETGLAKLAAVDRDAPIAGRTIERVEARGKHLLMRFSGGLILRTHLRMNGAWHIYRPGERWQKARSRARIAIETADFVAVGFDIPVADFISDAKLARDPALSTLGPDLLAPDFDLAEARRRLRARGGPIGEALLDQRALAGIGNIYKCEALFASGVHPETPTAALGDGELTALLEVARKLLSAGAHEARPRRMVYDRTGQPCRRCGERIEVERHGASARATWWCPHCQPARPDRLG